MRVVLTLSLVHQSLAVAFLICPCATDNPCLLSLQQRKSLRPSTRCQLLLIVYLFTATLLTSVIVVYFSLLRTCLGHRFGSWFPIMPQSPKPHSYVCPAQGNTHPLISSLITFLGEIRGTIENASTEPSELTEALAGLFPPTVT